MGSVGPAVTYVAGMEAKARVEDGKVIPGKAVADLATGAGGATGVVGRVTALLSPAAEAVPALGNLVAWLTAAGAIAAVAGLLYRRWASARQREIDEALMTNPVAWIDPEPAAAEVAA